MSDQGVDEGATDLLAKLHATGFRATTDALRAWLRDAHRQRLGPTEAVERLLVLERSTRDANNLARRTRLAMIGTPTPLDRFDWSHPRAIDRGLYATNFGGGQVDITSGKFVFSASEAYWVENGKIQYPVKGATLIGNGPDSLTRISMIGNDLALDSGVGVCGKEGQSVPVGVGQPTLRIEGLTVGGTA